MPLERWLRESHSAAPATFMLGGTGHLILSTQEQAHVKHRLETEILPQVMLLAGDRTLHILTGLAPGADHLFSLTAANFARTRNKPYQVVGLLPLPIAVMLDDWAERMSTSGHAVTQVHLTQQLIDMEAERVACNRVVHLMPPETTAELIQQREFRQLQYQRLAACLAEQSDALIAILRPESPVHTGGTAEVVKWRQSPDEIPHSITTLTQSTGSKPRGTLLFTLNPELLGEAA